MRRLIWLVFPHWLQIDPEKVHKFFFAGQRRDSSTHYSHGVRQTVFRLFNNTPGKPATLGQMFQRLKQGHLLPLAVS